MSDKYDFEENSVDKGLDTDGDELSLERIIAEGVPEPYPEGAPQDTTVPETEPEQEQPAPAPDEVEEKPKKRGKKAKKEPGPQEDIEDGSFELPPDFGKHFAPSDTFIGDLGLHDLPEEEVAGAPEPSPKKQPAKPRPVDVPVEVRARGLEAFVGTMKVRCILAAILCVPMVYISVSHKFSWYLPELLMFIYNPYIYLMVLVIFEVLIMYAAIDIISVGIYDICKFKPSSESLVALTCIATLMHAVGALIYPDLLVALPYCAVSGVSVTFALWGSYLRLNALKISCRTAASSANPYIVTREELAGADKYGFIKTVATTKGFVEMCETPDILKRFSSFFAPLVIVGSIVLALISSVGHGEPRNFLLAFSAIAAPAASLSIFFGFGLPFVKVAKKLATSGAAISGWNGARVLASSNIAVLGDLDLFPPGAVTLNGFKVLGNYSVDKVISYAASLICVSGSGLSVLFAEALQGQASAFRRVENFQHYEGGGLGGDIDGVRVLVGSSNFMLRMGIRLPRGINVKDAIFVSFNIEPAGIFIVRYTPPAASLHALAILHVHSVKPMLATRDFSITPAMITSKFKMRSELVEFPDIENRLELSDPERKTSAKPVAVVTREGLLPFAECIVLGKRLAKVTRLNMAINALGATLGVLIMFFLMFTQSFSSASPANLIIFMLMWTIPALLISGWVSRY